MIRLVLLLLLLLPSLSWGATYWVDNRCTYNGTGLSNSCAASAGQLGAYNSMANMVADVGGHSDGDIIDGNGLTYYEYFEFPSSGTSDYIILKNFTLDGTVSIDGTYTYYYDSSDTYATYSDGSQLCNNAGFETFTGTEGDGTSDAFDVWTEVNSSGNLTEASTTKHGGDYAVKLTYGTAAAYVYHSYYVMPGQTYSVTFWTRGDGTKAGRIAPYTGTGTAIQFTMDGSSYTGATSTGVTGTDYTMKTITFTVPAACTTVGIRLYSPVSAGVAYFDDVTITATNGWVNVSGNIWKKYCNSTPQIMLEDGKRLTPVVMANETAVVAGLAAGQYSRVHDTAAIRVLYYYASDGAAPTAHSLRISRYFKDSATVPRSLIRVTTDYVSLQDIILKHWGCPPSAVGYYALMVDGANHVKISNVTAEWNNYGAGFLSNTGMSIERLSLIDNSSSGAIISGGGDYDISFSKFIRNGGYPYYLKTSYSYGVGDSDDVGVGGDRTGNYTTIKVTDSIFEDAGTPSGQTAKGTGFYIGSTDVTFSIAHLEFLRNKIINSSWGGFYGENTEELIFAGNEVYGTRYAHAVTIPTSPTTGTFDYAYIYNNTIHDNPCTADATTGLHISGIGMSGVKMKNNIIYNNGSASKAHNDLWIEQTGIGESDYNIIYRTDAGEMIQWVTTSLHNDDITGFRTATGQDTHTLFADPMLTSTTQGRLRPGSPAINAGTDVSLTSDIEGRAVPLWGLPDIGAYEYHPGQHLMQPNGRQIQQ